MAYLLLDPLTIWFRWYLKSRKLLFKERRKNLKIGYMSFLSNVTIGNYNTFYDNVTIIDSKIADFVYVGCGSRIINTSIGKFCSVGGNVKIGLGKHPNHLISTFPAFFSTRRQCQITFSDKNYFVETEPIVIGNDVWIGENATIMDNINIGDGAIIAAGAVVTKNVEPYSIVAGVPAHQLKKRFTDEEINMLLNFKWWDKEFDWLKANFYSFLIPEVFFRDIINDENSLLNPASVF